MAIHLTFRQDRCKGCGLCVAVCPKHILALEGGTNVKGYHPASCTDEARLHRLRQLREDVPRFHHHHRKRLKGAASHETRNLEGQRGHR